LGDEGSGDLGQAVVAPAVVDRLDVAADRAALHLAQGEAGVGAADVPGEDLHASDSSWSSRARAITWSSVASPAATSGPRCTRRARRWRLTSTSKSPRACAASTTPKL